MKVGEIHIVNKILTYLPTYIHISHDKFTKLIFYEFLQNFPLCPYLLRNLKIFKKYVVVESN